MDQEKIHYILTYFSNLMSHDEKLALKHNMYMSKSSDNITLRNMMAEKGWINNDPETLNLLKYGYEEFERNVVKRILTETPDQVFFNNCPQCGKLARTPQAKQCRYCAFSWRCDKEYLKFFKIYFPYFSFNIQK